MKLFDKFTPGERGIFALLAIIVILMAVWILRTPPVPVYVCQPPTAHAK